MEREQIAPGLITLKDLDEILVTMDVGEDEIEKIKDDVRAQGGDIIVEIYRHN